MMNADCIDDVSTNDACADGSIDPRKTDATQVCNISGERVASEEYDVEAASLQAGLKGYFGVVQDRMTRKLKEVIGGLPNVAPRLVAAMEYACLSGGKRLRPALVYAACSLFKGVWSRADCAALAVEIVHAYSLIHDDLPAMDDDTLRRGQPTCHVAFDEATAILAGDALQSLAFEVLVTEGPKFGLACEEVLSMVRVLAQASGTQGMAAGQALDLEITGNEKYASLGQAQKLVDLGVAESHEALLQLVHRHKTGCLFRASLEMGAIAAGVACSSSEMAALRRYGDAIGLAFQIQDDILDATGSTQVMGKVAGADELLHKLTYSSVLGLKAAREQASYWCQEARDALACLPAEVDVSVLLAMADFLIDRDH